MEAFAKLKTKKMNVMNKRKVLFLRIAMCSCIVHLTSDNVNFVTERKEEEQSAVWNLRFVSRRCLCTWVPRRQTKRFYTLFKCFRYFFFFSEFINKLFRLFRFIKFLPTRNAPFLQIIVLIIVEGWLRVINVNKM